MFGPILLATLEREKVGRKFAYSSRNAFAPAKKKKTESASEGYPCTVSETRMADEEEADDDA